MSQNMLDRARKRLARTDIGKYSDLDDLQKMNQESENEEEFEPNDEITHGRQEDNEALTKK